MGTEFNDSAIGIIVIGIILLWGSGIIYYGAKDQKKFLNKRYTIFYKEFLGEESAMKFFQFLGKLYLFVGIGIIILALLISMKLI